MAHRKKVPAKEWRTILKEKEIVPHTILFPHQNALEILIPKDQEVKTRQFFRSLDRTAVNPDPYARRDGQKTPLPPETLEKTALQRIEMLQYERSLVAIKYLEKTVLDVLSSLPSERVTSVRLQLQKAMMERLSPQRPTKETLTSA